MDQKQHIINTIKTISGILADKDVLWLIGGSSSLLIHGIDIIPNDVDIVADPGSYEKVKELLQTYLTGETKPHADTRSTPYTIGSINGEIIEHDIKPEELVTVIVDNIPVSVYKLEREYDFYKRRAVDSEKSRKKLELIEEKLSIK